jgi:type I restriction enzyme R subunit
MNPNSANFGFLEPRAPALFQLAALAEHYFPSDPSTSLIKLRQFAEVMAREVAAQTGLLDQPDQTLSDLLRRLRFERAVPPDAGEFLHQLRALGNRAVHDGAGSHGEALSALKIARQLAIWFHRLAGGSAGFQPGPFTPPRPPVDPAEELRDELARLRAELAAAQSERERVKADAEAAALALLTTEERLAKETADRATWEQLAQETDVELQKLTGELAAVQAQAVAQPAEAQLVIERSNEAAAFISIDEAATRTLIDQQLRDAGWDADTPNIRFSKGTRPAKGANLAISEWPTETGPADYALFAGLKLVGVVEAKRKNKNVMSVLPQAERYSTGITIDAAHLAEGSPWGDHRAPFVFSTNGRPYLKQVETLSGIWRRDVRRATNPAAALVAWPTPQGLLERLEVDKDAAEANLAEQGFNFGFPLRPYQRQAIEAVEGALADDRTQMLVAMATGTGKTKLAIALLYRLIAAKRFRRVCFVVDRSALGDQTEKEFTTTKVVSGKGFAEIFGLKGLTDVNPDPETRVHICTIQGLVRRVLFAETPAEGPPIDQYDLIVVDECHRGYLLDREMSDSELNFRSQDDYVSKYRRVLDHFDAVKIGLTATPALHTVEIFGKPIFTYSYREAVIDGFLIDHEPPVRITTALAQSGIHFEQEQEVEFVHPPSGQIELVTLPDSLDFEVDSFNKSVVTEAFNRTVAEELTRHIDPGLPDKTLVFAASDIHADIVVNELRTAFRAAYGEVEDAAIRKLTGSVDKVGKLILSYRNDALPKVAVTVDLLTTGIDVPKITNLVFLRRVNSRILYEQMLGRATRLCPEIGKETFRIFDAVDLYARLQNLTDMKPVASDPKLTLTQLLAELVAIDDAEHRTNLRDQIIVRMNRRIKRLADEARAAFELEAGETPETTLDRFRHGTPDDLATWAKARPRLGPLLDWTTDGGTPIFVPISDHPDEVVSVTRGYGNAEKPEDFLDEFAAFVRGHINDIAALNIVVQRPRDLTREALRQLRLTLDAQGFTDAKIRRAWSDTKNEDIAASIIGYIRQAALGDPLIPYADRVRRAIDVILRRGGWTDVQKRWLHRIGEQLEKEIVVDRAALDQEPFKADGGFRLLNKRFDGKLETLLADISEEVWRVAS